jgi:2-dehydro-3-deoxygluconokinase
MSPEVVVIGEVLVELSTSGPLQTAKNMSLGFSGDSFNAAAAAAAAGAHVALLTRVADDDLGEALIRRVAELGVDTSLMRRVPGQQQGIYFLAADPSGEREFTYVRRGSAGSQLSPLDLAAARLDRVPVTLSSGITCALSKTAAAAVEEAGRIAQVAGRHFFYDPNHRPRLTSKREAAAQLARVAPYATLVTPACPGESFALLGTRNAADAARQCRKLGAAAVAVTCGAEGVLLDDGDHVRHISALAPPQLVDQTGAGDVLVGTIAGRIARGDDLLTAVELACSAASLSLQGQGGTGYIASLAEAREHLRRERAEPGHPEPATTAITEGITAP